MTGSGTAADPYIIYDATDLQNMALDLTAYYELANDIDASGVAFTPVGDFATPFTGHLDGKGYVVDELSINLPALTYVGLFGCIVGASIQNISLTNVNIAGARYLGALVGRVYGSGTISNCSSSGIIVSNNAPDAGGLVGHLRGGTITECSSSVAISGGQGPMGGLIGYHADANVTKCYVTGNVTGPAAGGGYGGLIGQTDMLFIPGTISLCYATGNVSGEEYVGGLIGEISALTHVENCYARGDIVASAADPVCGGFVGPNDDGIISNSYSTGSVNPVAPPSGLSGGFCGDIGGTGSITDCFWDIDTSGMAVSDGGTGKTTAEMKTEGTFTDAGWDFTTIWDIFNHCNNGYPCLRSVTPSCCVITPTVTTDPETGRAAIHATLNGTLDNDGGETCQCGFEWGLTDAYGLTTPTDSKITGETFSQIIRGLFPDTVYHFRAFGTNSVGTGYGDDRSFTTAPTFNRGFALAREEL